MPFYAALIVTDWDLSDGQGFPTVAKRHTGTFTGWQVAVDDCPQSPDPNIVSFIGTWLTHAQLNVIEADSQVSVVWSREMTAAEVAERPVSETGAPPSQTATTVRAPDAQPSAQQRANLITFLTGKGASGPAIAAIVTAGKTRAQLDTDLRAHLKTLPPQAGGQGIQGDLRER